MLLWFKTTGLSLTFSRVDSCSTVRKSPFAAHKAWRQTPGTGLLPLHVSCLQRWFAVSIGTHSHFNPCSLLTGEHILVTHVVWSAFKVAQTGSSVADLLYFLWEVRVTLHKHTSWNYLGKCSWTIELRKLKKSLITTISFNSLLLKECLSGIQFSIWNNMIHLYTTDTHLKQKKQYKIPIKMRNYYIK